MDQYFNISNLAWWELTLAAIFCGSLLIQFLYYILVFARFAYNKPTRNSSLRNEPVSVIISAHDEDYNLRKNLPAILNQKYHDFEVVVVDHASSDESEEILKEYSRNYSNLKIVTIKQDLNFFKGKKFPLSIGIKSASNDLLLLTDADCKPASENWIQLMVDNYESGKEIILGYGPYTKKKGFLDKLIRYDTLMIAIQYFSMAISGIPYMGVGRNLSYRKSLFLKNKGFISHYGISSGDDDLFIMQVANKKNIGIETSPDSHMFSEPKPSFSTWFTQKSRHVSTGKVYPLKFKVILGAFSFSQILLYLSFIILVSSNILILPALSLFLVYTSARIIIQKKAATKLCEEQLLLFSLIGDFIHICIMIAIYVKSLIKKQQHWK